MSIKKSIIFKGLKADGAIITVVSPSILEGNRRMIFLAQYRSGFGEDILQTLEFEASYSLDGPNPIEQAYEYLKLLPEFEDAEDC